MLLETCHWLTGSCIQLSEYCLSATWNSIYGILMWEELQFNWTETCNRKAMRLVQCLTYFVFNYCANQIELFHS